MLIVGIANSIDLFGVEIANSNFVSCFTYTHTHLVLGRFLLVKHVYYIDIDLNCSEMPDDRSSDEALLYVFAASSQKKKANKRKIVFYSL